MDNLISMLDSDNETDIDFGMVLLHQLYKDNLRRASDVFLDMKNWRVLTTTAIADDGFETCLYKRVSEKKQLKFGKLLAYRFNRHSKDLRRPELTYLEIITMKNYRDE